MSGLLESVLTASPALVYVVVTALVFAEDAVFVGFLVPGETAAILGGVAANQGHVPLAAVLAVVVFAAIVGDSVGYEIGRTVGPRVLSAHLFDKRRDKLDQAQDFLGRRGGWAVFLGRWVAFFRAVMPALAGTSRMHYPRFLAFNAAGGVVWGVVVVMVGYAAGASYATVEKTLGKGVAIGVAAVLVAGFIAWRVREHRAGRAEPEAVTSEVHE